MLSTKLDAGTIPAINGLKFLSMCCIILVHSAYFTQEFFGEYFRIHLQNRYFLFFSCLFLTHNKNCFVYTDNKAWGWRVMENYGAYIFDIAVLSVDTFFFSSACLVTYLYLKNRKNEGPIKPIACGEKLNEFFIHIIKRFIR